MRCLGPKSTGRVTFSLSGHNEAFPRKYVARLKKVCSRERNVVALACESPIAAPAVSDPIIGNVYSSPMLFMEENSDRHDMILSGNKWFSVARRVLLITYYRDGLILSEYMKGCTTDGSLNVKKKKTLFLGMWQSSLQRLLAQHQALSCPSFLYFICSTTQRNATHAARVDQRQFSFRAPLGFREKHRPGEGTDWLPSAHFHYRICYRLVRVCLYRERHAFLTNIP